MNLLSEYSGLFASLHCFDDMRECDIDVLQLRIDGFCRHYILMFGSYHITNYFHDLQAGHFSYFLRRYGIHRHSNIGLEASVGTTSTYINRGTQRGGHAGRKHPQADTPLFTEVDAVSRYFTSKVVCAMAKISGDKDSYIMETKEKGSP